MGTAPQKSPSPYKYSTSGKLAKVDAAIQQNLNQFTKPNVLSVRPGFEMVNGLISDNPAIVVLVRKKDAAIADADKLPDTVAGIPVDVREADTLQKMRADEPQRYSQFIATTSPQYALPTFPMQREPGTGAAQAPQFSATLAASKPVKPEVSYTPAPGAKLDEVNEPMWILCHASPDAGWPTLKQFLAGVRTNLTAGMYDFTSAHILEALDADLKSTKADFHLTLDHPTKNPTADQTDDETVGTLKRDLKAHFKTAWALVRSSPKAPKWIYPTAYHIKVAVRDESSFWLSSGNWNNSNQPDIDPISDPEGARDVAKNSDRDWHTIVNHAGLAKTYQAFLEHDMKEAESIESSASAMAVTTAFQAELLPDELATVSAELAFAAKAPSRYFPPLRVPASGTAKIRIQPILTPDNYCQLVVPLIQSATKSFYMQTQYIHPSDNPDDAPLADLINAVIERQQNGIDVKIILSQWQAQGKGDWLEKLKETGLDLSSVRIQTGVHNKGIVVDSVTVMLGSQNWSGDGVIRNRDASLIIYEPQAAKYFEQIFLHDWQNMARPCSVPK